MSLSCRCLLALFVLGSMCCKDGDRPSEPSGKGGEGGSAPKESGGSGGASTRAGGSGGVGTGGSGGIAAVSGSSGGSAAGGCSADCEAGQHCEVVAVTCVRAPCPPLPMCVPDDEVKEPAPRDCDPRKILCKRVAPECPEMQVPSVDGSCYGECVDVEACQCTGPEACPLPEKYTCHMSAKHCTPYLR